MWISVHAGQEITTGLKPQQLVSSQKTNAYYSLVVLREQWFSRQIGSGLNLYKNQQPLLTSSWQVASVHFQLVFKVFGFSSCDTNHVTRPGTAEGVYSTLKILNKLIV